MNPAERIWNIPPPPGTEEEEEQLMLTKEKESTSEHEDAPVEKSPVKAEPKSPDCLSPKIKVEPVEQKEKISLERSSRYHSRSRSRSRDRYHRRRYSRSRSRDRYNRRSRSRSRRRRRKYSSSRSRSRSPSYRRRHKYGRHKRSSSRYSRSRSRSYSKSRHKSHRSKRTRDRSRSKTHSTHGSLSEEHHLLPDADTNEIDMKIEEEDDEEVPKDNVFKNDGSFLEMFKKMQEQQQKAQEDTKPSTEEPKKPVLPAFGKRRGGKVLKTGLVEKVRLQAEEESNVTDAWSVYMKEVRRYKEACCDDDSKTRPLVK